MKFKCVCKDCNCTSSIKKFLQGFDDKLNSTGYEFTKVSKDDVFICPACGDMMIYIQ